MAPAKRPGQSDNETQRRRLQDLLVFEADVKKGGAGTPRKIFANLLTSTVSGPSGSPGILIGLRIPRRKQWALQSDRVKPPPATAFEPGGPHDLPSLAYRMDPDQS